MNSNYARLIEELQGLVNDRQVKACLDPSIKMRADRILEQKERKELEQLVDQLGRGDETDLFAPSFQELSQPFEGVLISRGYNQSGTRRQELNGKPSELIDCQPRRSNQRIKTGAVTEKTRHIETKKLNHSTSKDKLLKDIKKFSSNCHCAEKRLISREKNTSRNNSLSHTNPKQSTTSQRANNPSKGKCIQRIKQKSLATPASNKENYFATQASQTGKQPSPSFPDSNVEQPCFKLSKNKPKTKISQGREILEQLANIDTYSCRFSRRNRSASASTEKNRINDSLQHQKQQTLPSKQSYEEMIVSLKRKIIDQRLHLKTINQNIASIQNQIIQIQSKHHNKQVKIQISRKQSQSFVAEARKIEQRIEVANKNNDILIDNIAEEHYLLTMYNRVLAQIQSQLQEEQQELHQLKQQLTTFKHTEHHLRDKFAITAALSDQLFDSMRTSLRKHSKTKL